jgi:hypothetical protein
MKQAHLKDQSTAIKNLNYSINKKGHQLSLIAYLAIKTIFLLIPPYFSVQIISSLAAYGCVNIGFVNRNL